MVGVIITSILTFSNISNSVTIRNFSKSDIGILHRLQTGKIIIGALQSRGTIRSALLQGCSIEQYLTAKVNTVAIITEIVDIANLITGMIGFGCIAASLILRKMQG